VKKGEIHKNQWLHRWVWVLFDGGIWFVAIYAATWLRFDFTNTDVLVDHTLLFASVAAAAHFLVGALIGPYAVGHRRGSFEETTDLAGTVLATASALLIWAFLVNPIIVPRSVPIVAGALALMGMFAIRFIIRSWRSRHVTTGEDERRVIVFGAGDAGRQLLRSMMRDEQSGFFPVALLDDNKAKHRLIIDGVRVRGTRNDIGAVAQEFDATALVVALPMADSETIRELSDLATAAGLDILILPPLRDIILAADSIGTGGEVMVLEMGEQVEIIDVATTLIRLSGRKDIDIVYTGLRPGEKISEDLFSMDEVRRTTANPLVHSVGVPTVNVDEVRSVEMGNHKAAAVWMRQQAAPSVKSGV
jgi:FlaA1/EpsC-like NDP-sugar epimerase